MADPRAIHEFTTGEVEATTLLLGDFVDLDAQSGYTTLKMSVSDLGEVLLEDIEYTQDLQTVDKTITGAINENKSVIGYSYDEYDATTAYAKDDLCIYNNVLYKAKQATTGNLPTNTTYWEPTSIADEISEVNGKLIKRVSETIQLSQVTFTQSSSGMYYYETTLNIPSGSLIVSISCGNWGKLRSTDIIEPYIAASNKLGLMSNIGTFLSDSVIELIAIYI